MREKGQSLIEVMVALGVSVIIVTAIVMAVVLAIVNTQFAKTQNLATYFAKQGLEILRQSSRSDWNNFKTYTGSYCLAKDSIIPVVKSTDCEKDTANNFRREVEVRPESDECVIESDPTGQTKGSKIEVVVSWNDGKCRDENTFCHEVRLDSCFQNIKAVPTP
jgi:Tfp pilus assembly protein PilV